MRLLLDTHTFLWCIMDVPRLSKKARNLIEDGDNDIVVSAASAWEIAVKCELGKLRLPTKASAFISAQLVARHFEALPITISHAMHAAELPSIHRDPFDRLLVAQSTLDGMPVITCDSMITQYDVKSIW